MSEYIKQAEDFCEKYGIKIKWEYLGCSDYFKDGKYRDTYKWTLFRNGKRTSGRYGASINDTENGIKPTSYDLLACLTKSDPGAIDDFVAEYGYQDVPFCEVNRIYKAVKREYEGLIRVFGEEIDSAIWRDFSEIW